MVTLYPFLHLCMCVYVCVYLYVTHLQFHERGILSFGQQVANPATQDLEAVMSPALFVFRYIGMVINTEAERQITSYTNNTPQMRDAEDFIRVKTGDTNFTADFILIAEWRRLNFDCCEAVSFNCSYMYYAMSLYTFHYAVDYI